MGASSGGGCTLGDCCVWCGYSETKEQAGLPATR